jgi:outer membrane lipoprotein-sorting protein
MLVPLVFVLALHAADQNDAEKQFRQMEMKLTNAKTIECTFEAKLEGDKEKGNLKGELTVGEGNKSQLEMGGDMDGKAIKATMIVDGTKMVVIADDKPKGKEDTPKWLNDAYRAAMVRSGLFVPLMFIHRVGEQPKEFKADDEFKVSDFKLGKKEKVGDQEGQAIQYKLHIKEFPEPLALTVWMDTKKPLPLKRVITMMKDKEKMTITETYSKLNLDEKVDTKKFELPKD